MAVQQRLEGPEVLVRRGDGAGRLWRWHRGSRRCQIEEGGRAWTLVKLQKSEFNLFITKNYFYFFQSFVFFCFIYIYLYYLYFIFIYIFIFIFLLLLF